MVSEPVWFVVNARDARRRRAVLAVGALQHQESPGWGGYTVEEAALRRGAGVERETTDSWEAYARVPHRLPSAFQEGWLSGK